MKSFIDAQKKNSTWRKKSFEQSIIQQMSFMVITALTNHYQNAVFFIETDAKKKPDTGSLVSDVFI